MFDLLYKLKVKLYDTMKIRFLFIYFSLLYAISLEKSSATSRANLDVKNRNKRFESDSEVQNRSVELFLNDNQDDAVPMELAENDFKEPHYYTIDENTYTCKESRKIGSIDKKDRLFSEYDEKEECEEYSLLRCIKKNELEIRNVGYWSPDQWRQCEEVTFAGFSRRDFLRQEYGVSCLYTPCSCIVLGTAPTEAFLYSLRDAYSFEECEKRLKFASERNDQFREVVRFDRITPSFKTHFTSLDLAVKKIGPSQICVDNVKSNKLESYQYLIFSNGLHLGSPIIVNMVLHDVNETLVKFSLVSFSERMMKRNILNIAIRVQDKAVIINDKHSGCWSRGYTVQNSVFEAGKPFTLNITPEIRDLDIQFTVEYEDAKVAPFSLSNPLIVEMRPEYSIERYSYMQASGPVDVSSYCHTPNN